MRAACGHSKSLANVAEELNLYRRYRPYRRRPPPPLVRTPKLKRRRIANAYTQWPPVRRAPLRDLVALSAPAPYIIIP